MAMWLNIYLLVVINNVCRKEVVMNIVEFKNVVRTYASGDNTFNALDGIDLSLEDGKLIVILGPSGAGKSTLLNMLGGLDSPTSGTIIVDGKDIATLSNNE